MNTLRLRLFGSLLALGAAGFALQWALPWQQEPLLATAGAALITLLALWLSAAVLAPLRRLLRSLEGAVLSYRDGDFSTSVSAYKTTHGDELGQLVGQHAALGEALREQRQHLAQRELLLDTVVQNTPVALVLSDGSQRIVYANLAARDLLGAGRSLEGSDFAALMAQAPPALQRAVQAGDDALFSVTLDGSDESFHLSQRGLRLQGRPHRLHLFRRMTRELSRQEVATWKRVIRVISHELNNSLAPISSLAHTGAELVRRGDDERALTALASIGERAHHLHAFIDGYARFARLPSPQLGEVAWQPFIARLQAQYGFALQGELPKEPGRFDATQVEQALINLLKNAFEAGGDRAAVTLTLHDLGREVRFDVADSGPGMSETVLAQALLPFYSTKRNGTGLGLALAREIAEAHGGRIALFNRSEGGLKVSLSLGKPAAERAH